MRAVICLLVFVTVSHARLGEVEEAFISNGIDKDLIEPVPTVKLQVHYPKSKVIVNLGNILSTEDVLEPPEVTYDSDPKALYTLLMTDLDALSRKNPSLREVQHWLIVNIPGSDVSKGELRAVYKPPSPPKNSGLHRYVFLLFKQPGKINVTEEKHLQPTTDGRAHFSTRKFVEKYKLGDAVAGNFYQSE